MQATSTASGGKHTQTASSECNNSEDVRAMPSELQTLLARSTKDDRCPSPTGSRSGTVTSYNSTQSRNFAAALREPPGAVHYYGKWSSGIFDVANCWGDVPACLCSFCPIGHIFLPWRVWILLDRIGSVQSPAFFGGRVDKFRRKFIVSMLFILLALSTAMVAVAPRLTLVFYTLYTLFVWEVYVCVRFKFRIEEWGNMAMAQVFCCSTCSILKIGRHVDGYFHQFGIMAPDIPIVGVPVSARPSLVAAAPVPVQIEGGGNDSDSEFKAHDNKG